MDEATLCQALGLDLSHPTSAKRLTDLAQAMIEITDELDGLSSRLALVSRALTITAVAMNKAMAQHATDEARAQMSTRERLQDSASDEGTDGPMDEGIQEEVGREGASAASAGDAGPTPLADFEVLP